MKLSRLSNRQLRRLLARGEVRFGGLKNIYRFEIEKALKESDLAAVHNNLARGIVMDMIADARQRKNKTALKELNKVFNARGLSNLYNALYELQRKDRAGELSE